MFTTNKKNILKKSPVLCPVLTARGGGHSKTCYGLQYKLPNFFKFHESNRNSYDHVAEVLLVHNC